MTNTQISQAIHNLQIKYRTICKTVKCCLGISAEGDVNLFLNQQGDWVSAGGGSITGDPNQVVYFDFTGNIASDAGFTRDVLGATTKIYADESNIFGGIFLNGAVGQFGYSNNSIALNNYYFADSGNLGWTIGANTWTLPTTDGSLGDILTTNGLGQLSWTTPGGGGLTFDNGLTETAGNVQLGGTLIQTTDINANGQLYSVSNTYANYISGTSGGITANWIRKNTSPTVLTAVGLADFSGFGQDVNTIVLGTLDFGGNPSTNVRILPTSGELRSLFVDGANRAFLDIEQTGAGSPSIMLASRVNQTSQLGYYAVDDSAGSGKMSADLHYATLDASNIPTIVSQVETTNSQVDARHYFTTFFNGFAASQTYSQLEFGKTADDGQVTGLNWVLDANGFAAWINGVKAVNIKTNGNLVTTAGEEKVVRIENYGSPLSFTSTDYHLALTGAGTGGTTIDISGMTTGQIAIISDLDFKAGANNITIDTGIGNTICSLTGIAQTYVVSTDGESVTIQKITSTKFKMI